MSDTPTAASMIANLPGFASYINVKCRPGLLKKVDWPFDREMATPTFGPFLPDEVKRVVSGPAVAKLIRSGHFEITEDDPNSEEIRAAVAEKVAARTVTDVLEEEEEEKP